MEAVTSKRLTECIGDMEIIKKKLAIVEIGSKEHQRLLDAKKLKQQSIDFHKSRLKT